MLKFTSIFLGKCSADMALTTSPVASLASSTISTGTGSVGLGTYIIKESDGILPAMIGITASHIGTTLINNSIDTYEQLETTQAYVESLNEDELSELIARLEMKETELSPNKEFSTKTR